MPDSDGAAEWQQGLERVAGETVNEIVFLTHPRTLGVPGRDMGSGNRLT